jgi:hypothetical protein
MSSITSTSVSMDGLLVEIAMVVVVVFRALFSIVMLLSVTWIFCVCLLTPHPMPDPALRNIHETPTFSITFSKSPSIDVHFHSPENEGFAISSCAAVTAKSPDRRIGDLSQK